MMAVTGGEAEPARKVQGTRANLAGVMCRLGVTGGGGTAVNRGGGDGA
jgi:hypothetical protein